MTESHSISVEMLKNISKKLNNLEEQLTVTNLELLKTQEDLKKTNEALEDTKNDLRKEKKKTKIAYIKIEDLEHKISFFLSKEREKDTTFKIPPKKEHSKEKMVSLTELMKEDEHKGDFDPENKLQSLKETFLHKDLQHEIRLYSLFILDLKNHWNSKEPFVGPEKFKFNNIDFFYYGQKKNNLNHGYGELFSIDGLKYFAGFWHEGEIKGKFIVFDYEAKEKDALVFKSLDSDNGTMEKWLQITGIGEKFYKEGGFFVGEFHKGKKEGKGVKYYPNGNKRYEGEWKDGWEEGEGFEYFEKFENKVKYNGEWKSGRYNGKGILYYENGEIWYDGDWLDGRYDGKGILYYENGKILYVGDFKNGRYEGRGIEYDEKGNMWYEGDWRGGKQEGEGVQFFENGEIEYQGFFKNGKKTSFV